MRLLRAGVLLVAGFCWSSTMNAENLPLERIFSDPSLSGSAPRALRFAPDGKSVTFLRGKAERSEQLDLWLMDVASGRESLLVDSNALLDGRAEQLSEEEKARRERLRLGSFSGILDYQFSADGKQLLFPLNGALFVYALGSRTSKQLTKVEDGFATDPKFSPKGNFVSFVRAQNLWLVALEDGKPRQLTREGGGSISLGMAEFVAQEEMDRLTGYWWSPDETQIALTRFDESKVPLQKRMEIYADRTDFMEQRYPFAGTTNVTIGLGLLSLDSGKTRWFDLGKDADIYLARVDWRPDSSALVWQRQNRDQRELDLIEVNAKDLSTRVLLTERSKTWVNLHNNLRLLKDGSFLWSSESADLERLEWRRADGALASVLSPPGMLVESVLSVNEQSKRIYLSGSMPDDRLSRHVYALELRPKASGKALAITRQAGMNDAVVATGSNALLLTYSNPSQPPQVSLHDRSGKRIRWIEENRLDSKHPYFPYLDAHQAPEFGSLRAEDGTELMTRMIKPPNFNPNVDPNVDSGKRYPVLVYQYAGPHVQVVQRQWDARWGLFLQHMAQQGFVVYSLDNRGSARRGKAFEDALYRRMGELEVRDQMQGIAWLAQQPWVDRKRIGVFGWSYGGYITLAMLAKHSDQIAAGVSVAPVSDWHLYDTHYTERYMDLPARNEAGYKAGDVLTHIDGLTSKLLLIHGMADDNVLFSHATRVMAALQERERDFRLMTYPGGKHGINSSPEQRRHVFRQIRDYLVETLAPEKP